MTFVNENLQFHVFRFLHLQTKFQRKQKCVNFSFLFYTPTLQIWSSPWTPRARKFGGTRYQLVSSADKESVNKTIFRTFLTPPTHPQLTSLEKNGWKQDNPEKLEMLHRFSSQILIDSLNFCNFHILFHFSNWIT